MHSTTLNERLKSKMESEDKGSDRAFQQRQQHRKTAARILKRSAIFEERLKANMESRCSKSVSRGDDVAKRLTAKDSQGNSTVNRAALVCNPRIEMVEGGSNPLPRRCVGNTTILQPSLFADYTIEDTIEDDPATKMFRSLSDTGSKPLVEDPQEERLYFRRRRRTAGDIIGDLLTSSLQNVTSTSSLVACLGDMGFDPSHIEMAIESTDAKSSADVPKVVEWLGNHEEQLKDDDSISSSDGSQYTRHTHAYAGTNGTAKTEESNESEDSSLQNDTKKRLLLDGASRKSIQSGDKQEDSSTSKRSSQKKSSSKLKKEKSHKKSSSKPKKEKEVEKEVEKEEEDTCASIEIAPGQFFKLLKGRDTWKAMKNGTAVSAACIICTVILQCCPKANCLLCPDCNVVSPLHTNEIDSERSGNASMVGVVGLGYKKE